MAKSYIAVKSFCRGDLRVTAGNAVPEKEGLDMQVLVKAGLVKEEKKAAEKKEEK